MKNLLVLKRVRGQCHECFFQSGNCPFDMEDGCTGVYCYQETSITKKDLLTKYVSLMKDSIKYENGTIKHQLAVNTLCMLLSDLGYEEVVDLFNKI